MASASATIAAPSNEASAIANSDAADWPAPPAALVVDVVGSRNYTAAALWASQGHDIGSLLVSLQPEPPQPAPNVHCVVPALVFGA